MPFTTGVFANVAGASSAVAGQIIQSAVWNNIHTDYSTALNMLMGQLITTPSNRNIAWMNGGFEIWQRGAGSSASISVAASTTAYTTDRWYLATDANEASVVSAQTGLIDESRLCARVQRNAAQTGVGAMYFAYPLDTSELYKLRGNTANLSFRVRAGANWSPASGTLSYRLYVGTGVLGKRGGTPYTGETTAISGSVNLTTTTALVQASSSSVVPTTTTQAEIQFTWTPVGTAGAADYFEVDDLQLELSLSPNTFTLTSYDRLDIYTMLEACKRFYQKTFPYGTAPVAGSEEPATALSFISVAAELSGLYWQFPVELRTPPSVTKFSVITATSSNWIGYNFSASYGVAVSASNTKGIFARVTNSVTAVGVIFGLHAEVSAGI